MSDFEKVKIFNPSNPTQLLEIYRFKDSRGNAKRGEIVPNLAKPERCPVRIIDYYMEKRYEKKHGTDSNLVLNVIWVSL